MLLQSNYRNYKKKRVICLSCKSRRLNQVLDLGLHSFADRFIKSKDVKDKDPIYPLVLDLCMNCGFIQSKFITNPKDRYYNYEYSYTSNNSTYSNLHWKLYANFLDKKFSLKKKKIVEIGSNDGLLSNFLKKKGAQVLCVDASPKMIRISRSRGLKSIQLIFNKRNSHIIKSKIASADIVIANNVFNHSDDPLNFLLGVKNLLNQNGYFIFEQPYFFSTLSTKKFDQIYHEHVSYFTAKNIENLLKAINFKILNIYKNNYHGGSLRVVSANRKVNSNISKKLSTLKKKEYKKNIYTIDFYKKYFRSILINKERIYSKIEKLKKKKYFIAAIGAGAKANTYLTFNGLNSDIIDVVTDSSLYKIGKYTPFTRIKIQKDIILKNIKKVACIILSWNIESLIKKKLFKINRNIKYIKP